MNIILSFPQFFWADVVPSPRSNQDCKMPYVDKTTLSIYQGTKSMLTFLITPNLSIYQRTKSMITFFIPLTITWVSYCSIIYMTRKSWKAVSTTALPLYLSVC